MKVTLQLTLDGLVQALRGKESNLADERDRGYAQPVGTRTVPRLAYSAVEPIGDARDDRPGR